MPKRAKALEAIEVKRIDVPGYHTVGHVPGLRLQVSATKDGLAKSWILRAMVGDKRREIGIGPYPAVTLAAAREKAQTLRETIAAGVDPVLARAEARRAILEAQSAEMATRWTFKRCAESYIAAMSPGWRNAKHAQQWRSTLEKYAYPVIGEMLVQDVGIAQVTEIIEPHWFTKNETINRVRNRIELVMDWATVRKYREGQNPARWKENIDKLLPKPSTVAPVQSHRALEAEDMYGFMELLRATKGTAARCLEFVILTASRSGEARLATWGEIDLDAATWSIPGTRMKSGRPHRVPLSAQAVRLLESLPRIVDTELLFPGRVAGKPLSDMALTKVMRDMGVDAVPHGFRATFSSWCGSSTGYPEDVREMALAHAIKSGTVAAYMRSDLFDKRRDLMGDWADFIGAPMPKADSRATKRKAS